jgi:hypothetical protein
VALLLQGQLVQRLRGLDADGAAKAEQPAAQGNTATRIKGGRSISTGWEWRCLSAFASFTE